MVNIRVFDFRSFNAPSSRAAEVHRILEARRIETTGISRWKIRQVEAAQEFLNKVLRKCARVMQQLSQNHWYEIPHRESHGRNDPNPPC